MASIAAIIAFPLLVACRWCWRFGLVLILFIADEP